MHDTRRNAFVDAVRRLAGARAALPQGLRDGLGDLARWAEDGLARWRDRLRGDRPRTAPSPGQFLSESFAGPPGRRAYRLYVPGGYRGRPVPLVVMLHGCTQSPEDFAAGTGMNVLADSETVLVAYPEQTRAANQARCWNWYSPGDQGRDSGEAGIIAGITRAVMTAYAVDPRRVFVAGISAGGAAAANVAAAHPELYAALGVHSGLCAGAARTLPGAIAAMRDGGTGTASPVPTIVFHGDRDTTVNPKNGAALATAAGGRLIRREEGRAGSGRTFERSLYADAAGRPAVEHWVIHGSGHAWSGGHPDGSYTDPQGPDATREMWRFFKEHPRRG
ncbi:extracellular catalytic domain type 1 short-chain-length polyhydroxyalkanoate depolymerase [Methylobacterium sp. SyP6R]|uniref:extracellular catalytic domain type 1 short-chain-length polyhydroxyalkanoate depolymerase n=1 Tax=Methylobacterium sp. SyP6R TaxID=2718876 RepID=UPI001F2BB567|nr:PHB depolymerase family esterase [Methylobacterium sp. SyP6R]MCF4128129.1 PHB depolymerase family esterase [Methylobacterium sp. SyP6R]